MINVRLYTTLGCHLCELAEALLQQVQRELPVTVQSVEIADDEQLVARYGVRIPVVERLSDHRELGWPFDGEGLRRFLTD